MSLPASKHAAGNARTPPLVGLAHVQGQVEKSHFSSPTFSAGKLRTPSGDLVPFVGKMLIREGESLTLQGTWESTEKYGRQLKVVSVVYDLAMDRKGLANYLANHPDLKGIGPAKAKLLAERFGAEFERHLTENPEAMAQAAHLPVESIIALRDEWHRTRAVNQALTALSAYGLTYHQVKTLTEKYQASTLAVLADDPYTIVRDIKGFGFRRVDQVAQALGTPKDHPGRIRAGILECVNEQSDQGHCWTEWKALIELAVVMLTFDNHRSANLVEPMLERLCEAGVLTSFPMGEQTLVADTDLHVQERDLAAWFHKAKQGFHDESLDAEAQAALDAHCGQLNERQRAAAVNALTHRISLISGGAGVGKSFTVAAIRAAELARRRHVIMAAPTGKAAKRLEQLTGEEAFTLHRLLGYNGKTFTKGPLEPIDADLLVMDEGSMCDVPLLWHVLRAVNFERTRVLLVGDHNQLPPVGPGNVLRDVVQRGLVPTTILDQVIRQAGTLKENSIAILSGRVPPTAPVDPEKGRSPWYVLDTFTDPAALKRMLLKLYESMLKEKLGFDVLRDVQLLTPTRKGELGVDALNAALQRLLQKQLHGVDVPELSERRRPQPLPHDKVIYRRNNYQLGVMNGALGLVTALDPVTGDLQVDFEGRTATLSREKGETAHLQLAYALTVHSTQGSEFPCVVMVVHKSHAFMHHRNLFYTGVTRAKETVVVLGDSWGVRNCAYKRESERRRTLLALLPPPQPEHVN